MFYQDDKQNPNPLQDNKQRPEQSNANVNASKKNQDVFERYDKPRDIRSSVFLKEPEKDREEQKGCCDRCCACLSVEYYKDNFKVTNQVVLRRIGSCLKFWSGGFFTDLKQDYDLYGPIWIYTTVAFVCSAVNNVLAYMGNSTNFSYNFGVIGMAFGIFYALGLGISAVFGLLFGCMGLTCKTIHIVCLYGYSMTAYVICVLLCIINMSMMTWLFLIYAAGTKVACILKNIFEKLEVPASKKIVITILVLAEAGIQLLAIKFALLSPTYPPPATVGVAEHYLQLRIHDGAL